METPGLSPLHAENVPASGPWPGRSGPRPRVSHGHGGGLEAGNDCGNEVSDARKGPSFPLTGKAFPDVTPPNLCPAWARMWAWGALPRRYYPGTSAPSPRSSLSRLQSQYLQNPLRPSPSLSIAMGGGGGTPVISWAWDKWSRGGAWPEDMPGRVHISRNTHTCAPLGPRSLA